MRARFLLCLLLELIGQIFCCTLNGPVDLGRVLDVNSIHFPSSPAFKPGMIHPVDFNGSQYLTNDFFSGEHTGTHLDSPFHFNPNGWSVDEIPLNRLIANGVFINLTTEVEGNPDFLMEPRHITEWEEANGPLPERAVVLISFGWAEKYDNVTLYTGNDGNDVENYRFPGVSEDAATALVNSGKVVGVGVDTGSVDAGENLKLPVHNILCEASIYILENVDLDQPCLPARDFTLYSLPMKILNGTGAPVRITAVPCSDSSTTPY